MWILIRRSEVTNSAEGGDMMVKGVWGRTPAQHTCRQETGNTVSMTVRQMHTGRTWYLNRTLKVIFLLLYLWNLNHDIMLLSLSIVFDLKTWLPVYNQLTAHILSLYQKKMNKISKLSVITLKMILHNYTHQLSDKCYYLIIKPCLLGEWTVLL